MRIIAALH
jgi:hypothetical protein